MARKHWWPEGMPEQVQLCETIIAKVPDFQLELPLTQAQVDKIVLACNTIITAIQYTDQERNTAKGLVTWRDNAIYGTQGVALDPPPPFGTYTEPAGATSGAFKDLSDGRQDIFDAPGYMQSIGETFDILGDEITPPVNFAPDLKLTTQEGYKIKVSGSLQGKKLVRLEFRATGATAWNPFGFLDELPGIATVNVTDEGAQTGHVRAIFVENNEPVGSYSPDYPVTLTP